MELEKVEAVVAEVHKDQRIVEADRIASSVLAMGYNIGDADTRIAANDDLGRTKQGTKAVAEALKAALAPANEYVSLVRGHFAPITARLEAAGKTITEGMQKWDRAEAARVEAERREQQRVIDEQRAAEAKAAKEAEEAGMEFEEPPPPAQVVVTEKPIKEQSKGGVSQTVIQRRVKAELENAADLMENPQWRYLLSLDAMAAVKEYKILAARGQAPDFPPGTGVVIGGVRFTTVETYASRGF